jgi:pimeloyl-ACP methyl ester carboxylesterase
MTPFEIAVSNEDLDDLHSRLRRTRWPKRFDAGWDFGTDPDYLRDIIDYWLNVYDWRLQERWLNTFAHFHTQVDGFGLHLIHQRGSGPEPMPLLLLHGWPGSFVQMLDIIPLLTDPLGRDGDANDSFGVVIPSLPGYGFSDQPAAPGMNEARMAGLFHALMTESLGYKRYAVRGADWGGGILTHLAAAYPQAIIGTHTGGSSPHLDGFPEDLSPAECRYIDDVMQWRRLEVGYSQEQSTKPVTLATGLNDSPAGLASWIVEKFRRWSDCNGNVETRFSKDALLTNIMIYWVTQTIGSSIRLYREAVGDAPLQHSRVPAAYLMTPKDMFRTPRAWVARTAQIDRWTEIDRGGHFLEWEEPQLVAEDLRTFLRAYRGTLSEVS